MMKFFKKKKDTKSEAQIALEMYEKSFAYIKNGKMHESNKHHANHPERVEHDLSELEKAHFDVMRAKLDFEIANEARKSNEGLQRAAWVLSAALVVVAFFELFQ